MKLADDQRSSPDTTEISKKLAGWYDAHASIRRLWAIEDGPRLTVCISLEPTSDGDDALPVWLAMSGLWPGDLQSFLPGDVHLKFVASDDLPPSYDTEDSVVVADVDWRESWIVF